MRLAHAYHKAQKPDRFRSELDASASDFTESLRVQEYLGKLHSWADFEQVFFGIFWVKEFHRILSQVLVKERRTLSIGSCFGENEAPFIREGYDIVCSDFNADVIAHMQQNFCSERYLLLDIFDPHLSKNDFQDLLITGLDAAFDDVNTAKIFRNCRELLGESSASGEKRLLFSLRYNDNLATRFIDQCLLPFENGLKNILMKARGSQTRYMRKAHGYRRSRKEIIAVASSEGFQLRRVVCGGYGVELTRSAIASRFNFLLKMATNADRIFKLLNNITLFEFVAV